jgi:hypothetical protein
LNGLACTTGISGVDLGGKTLVAGVYCSSGGIPITGTLTLDGGGNPNSVWVFQMASTLITSTSSQVLLTGGALACNVFWKVGSSTTIASSTQFNGNIYASASITVQNLASVTGKLVALNGAVSLDSNNVINCPFKCSIGLCFGKNATNPTVCSGNGFCVNTDTCSCYPNFSGVQCQTMKLNSTQTKSPGRSARSSSNKVNITSCLFYVFMLISVLFINY